MIRRFSLTVLISALAAFASLPGSLFALQSEGRASVKLDRGGKVSIVNNAGQIIVTGWDRDTVEATATDDSGRAKVQITGDSTRARVSIATGRYGGEITLKVSVPRYAEIESIEIHRGEVEVSDVEGAVSVTSINGDVTASRTGTLKVATRNGGITVRDVKGNLSANSFSGEVQITGVSGAVEASSFSGGVTAQNVGGAVSANSVSGEITIDCAKGRVELQAVSGSIVMTGIGGEVDAATTSGEVVFRGLLRAGGRYRLKSLSGDVTMEIQPDPPGFTASLTTYSGEIETAFPLKLDSALQGPINRRVVGRYGDGQAHITLDSFSSSARIIKGAATKNCP
jgi:DUF4097 and DUF4098 domain-containing protein YvlB